MMTKAGDESKLACVYTAAGQMEAQVIKTKLESANIPVLLQYDSASIVFGFTVDGLGEVRVMVPQSLAQEARQLLKQQAEEPQ